MNVYLTSAYPDSEPIESMQSAAMMDSVKRHRVVNTPELADLILFVENSRYHNDCFFSLLKENELLSAYPDKVFMYNPHDHPWFILPGLYPSMPKNRFDATCMATVPYITSINNKIRHELKSDPRFLYSFMGFPNSEVRRKLLKRLHPDGKVMATVNFYEEKDLEDQKLAYAETLVDSKYVLCPKGAGTSSFRIFEVMEAGRVPVIISDDWVPPKGVDWEKFAVFVKEKEIGCIAEILKNDQENWRERGRLARASWEKFFAPDVFFDYLIDCLADIKANFSKPKQNLYLIHQTSFIKFFIRKVFIEWLKMILTYR